jgi:hypothetical protein
MLRESSDRIYNSSLELGISGFHATPLWHLVVSKGVTEMEVHTEMLCQSIFFVVIFEPFRTMFYARRISTVTRYVRVNYC